MILLELAACNYAWLKWRPGDKKNALRCMLCALALDYGGFNCKGPCKHWMCTFCFESTTTAQAESAMKRTDINLRLAEPRAPARDPRSTCDYLVTTEASRTREAERPANIDAYFPRSR